MRALFIVLFLNTFLVGVVNSCSPYAVPPLSSQQVSGSSLILNWQSATAWACNYNIYVEIRCQSNPSGPSVLTHLSGCISKSSTATVPYPSAQTIDVSSLCSGETYIFRAKETPCGSTGGGSAWTADFVFVAGGVNSFLVTTSPSDTICIGSCATLASVAQNSCSPSITYSWDNGAGTDSVVTVCPTSTTTYVVTASTVTTCGAISVTDTMTITVELPPIGGSTVASPDHICEGDSSNVSLSGYNGVIQWQVGNTSTGPWANLGVGDTNSYNTPALFSDMFYRAELSNVCGVDFSTVATVFAEPFPVMGFSLSDICIYQTAQFNNTTTIGTGGIVDWNWDFGDGNLSTMENPTHDYSPPGTYSVGLIATSDYGCIDSLTQAITVHPEPIADYTTSDVCRYTPAQFNDNSSVTTGSIDNWLWWFDDGNTSTIQNPSHLYNSFGIFDVKLVVYTDNGCSDTLIQPIEIFAVPNADFSASTVCLNLPPTVFTNNSTIGDGSSIAYIWSFDDGDSAFTTAPLHTYLMDGVYDVVLINTSTNLCYDTITIPVEVYSIPIIDFVADTLEGCAPLLVTFTNNSSNAVSYQWDLGDGTVSGNQNEELIYTDPGVITSYTITLIGTTSNGCEDTLTFIDYITIWPLPIADFSAGPNPATILYPYMVFDNLSAGDLTAPVQYYWDFGDSTQYLGEDTLHTYNNEDTGTYLVQLIAENAYSCTDTAYDTIVIKYDYILYAPTAFTPNGDGFNDTFFPRGIGFGDPAFKYELLIFDRWGDNVFQTEDYLEGWDGSANNGDKPAQSDVYVWMIKTQDVTLQFTKHQYVGHVTLLR